MPWTEQHAKQFAHELRKDWRHHTLLHDRRAILARTMDIPWDNLGLPAHVRNVLPWQTERPNQAGHRFADLLSLPQPSVQVYSSSDKPRAQERGEQWENLLQAVIERVIRRQYRECRSMAVFGFGPLRVDIPSEYFTDAPESEDPAFSDKLKEHRQRMGWPFSVARPDPGAFYFEEDQGREHVVFGAETLAVRASEVKKDGDPSERGELLIIRTPEHIWHWYAPEETAGQVDDTAAELVWEGENKLGHTGYVLLRGRQTEHPDYERRYDPLILPSLNTAQQISIEATLAMNYGVLAAQFVMERDLPKMVDGQVIGEMKASGAGGADPVDQGQVADLEPGTRVAAPFRELAVQFHESALMLIAEEEKYQPPDVLFGMGLSESSGRNTIRLTENAQQLLSHGLAQREVAVTELLEIMRKALFSRPEFLTEGREVYMPHLVSDPGDKRDVMHRDVITITSDDNIPHEIVVKIASSSRAADLALMDEGRANIGLLSEETVLRDFMGVDDVPLERRRKNREAMYKLGAPAVIQDGVNQALELLAAEPLQKPMVAPQVEGEGGELPLAGQDVTASGGPGASGAATPPQPEDAGLAMMASRGNGVGGLP